MRLGAATVAGVGDEPGNVLSNAATEWILLRYSLMSELDAALKGASEVTEDFLLDDRRSGGFNFGRFGAADWPTFLASIWDSSSDQVHFEMREVLAVRDQRSAAHVEILDSDVATWQSIMCIRLNPGLDALERLAIFDLDSRVAAIAELNRMHAEMAD